MNGLTGDMTLLKEEPKECLKALVSEIVRLNTEGAKWMATTCTLNEKGLCNADLIAASRSFAGALTQLNVLVSLTGHMCMDEDLILSDDMDLEDDIILPTGLMSIGVAGLQDDRFYVFDSVVALAPSFMKTRSDISIAIIIVLHNLALANHALGVRRNDKDRMRKAIQLYEMCINAVLAGEGDLQYYGAWGDHLDLAVSLSIAARNNQAYLHYRFLDDPATASGLLGHICNEDMYIAESLVMSAAQISEVYLNHTLLLLSSSSSIAAEAA